MTTNDNRLTDIVERLRDTYDFTVKDVHPLMQEAADLIESLRKQIEAMKTAMPEWEGLPELRRMFADEWHRGAVASRGEGVA